MDDLIYMFFYNFVAAEYAKLPLILPYLHPGDHEYIYGMNFASGGAGALVETGQGTVCRFEITAFWKCNPF